jgi:uncharacterized protein YkwD
MQPKTNVAVIAVLATVSLLSASAATTAASASCANSAIQPARSNLAAVNAATFCEIDRVRIIHHLRVLRANSYLQRVAGGQARDMVIGGYFGDNSISGQTPLARILASPYPRHAKSVAMAQNIGWGSTSEATPAAMVRGWMTSSPHRQIILTPGYRDIGVGVAPAAPAKLAKDAPGATYTVEFGRRH